MRSAPVLPAPRRLALLGALFAFSLLSCGREVTGPDRSRLAMLALAPEFSGPMSAIDGAGDAVPFEKVRVVLRRDDGSIVKDTMVDFPSTAEFISLTLTIPIPQDAPAEGLPMTVAMAYVNAAGDTVFRGGPNALVAKPLGTPGATDPITVPVTWDGPAKNASRVAITPKTGNAVAGRTQAFAGTAFDANDQPIANTPFVFSTLDPTRASVDPVTGVATWLPVRGVARVVAQLPNGLRADTATFTVALPASKLVLASGGDQTGAVNTALGDTIVLRTLASDDVPVEGVIVTFAVTTGGGTLSASADTSDAEGKVKTVWTLGGTLGAQSITATSGGLTGSPFAVSATARSGAPARLEISQEPTSGTAGVAFAPALTVIARDAFGNTVPDFAGSVTLRVQGEQPPALLGTTTRTASAGSASFGDLVMNVAGSYRVIVESGTLAPDTTAAITVTPAAAARLSFVQEPTTAVAGATIAPALTLRTLDAFGNLTPSFTGAVSLTLRDAGTATLLGTATQNAVAGIATFADLQIQKAGTGYRLEASSGTLQPDTSLAFTVTAGAATQLTVVSGASQTGVAATALTTPLTVATLDAFGNPVSGVPVTWSVVSGAGTLSATTSVTNASGQASTTWTLGNIAGAQSAKASVATLPDAEFSATATAGTPTQLLLSAIPATDTAGSTLAPLTAQLRDALGNVVTSFTGEVSIALATNPGAATLGGTLTRAAVAGVATFDDLSLTKAGSGYTLRASIAAPAISSDTTSAFSIVSAAAWQFAIESGNNQTVIAGNAFAQPLRVRVLDAFGNPKVGHPTTWSTNGVVTLGSVGVVLTDAAGIAENTATAGTTAGAQSAGPSVITEGLGSVLIFEHTVTAATPTQIVFITQPDTVTAGEPFPPTLFLEVRDANGNRVATYSDSITISVDSGPVAGVVLGAKRQFITNGGGTSLGQFSGLEIERAGTYRLRATADGGVSGVSAPLVVQPDGFRAFALISGDRDTSAVGEPFGAPLRVRVTDSYGNPVQGAKTTWIDQGGGATLAADTVLTDVDGYAENTATHPATPVALSAITAFVVGGTDSRDFFYTTTAIPSRVTVKVEPPSTPTAGQAFSVTVEAQDAAGNRAVTYTDTTTVELLTAPVGATLGGTVKRVMVAGAVTFSGLTLNKTGAYTLRINALGLAPDTTVTLTVQPAAAAFPNQVTAPTSGSVGTALPAFAYGVYDGFDNLVTSYTGFAKVTLEKANVAQPDPVIISGDSVPVINGVATWSALIVSSVGQYKILADFGPSLGTYVSGTITIAPGAAVDLALDALPNPPTVNSVATPAFLLRARDAAGNLVTTLNDSAFVEVVSSPAGGELSGTDRRAFTGSVSFDDLEFSTPGSWTLRFVSPAVADTATHTFTVLPGAADTVVVIAGDFQTGTLLTSLANPLVVEVRDQFGNPLPDVSVVFMATTGSASVTVTPVLTDATGRAESNVVLGSSTDTVRVTATVTGVANPATFTVLPQAGTPANLYPISQPSNVNAGATMSAFVFQVRDSYGNVVRAFNDTVSLDAGAPASERLPGLIKSGAAVVAVNGVATFSDVRIDSAGTWNFAITAKNGPTYTSDAFTVTAGAPSLLLKGGGDGQSGTVGTTLASPLRVRVTDDFGNGIGGVTVNFNVITGSLPGLPVSIETDANGAAETTPSYATTAGAVVVGAYAAGLTPDSILFNLTATPDAVNGFELVSGGEQTVAAGDTTANAWTVRAKDGYGNIVPGVTVSFVTFDDVTFTVTSVEADASGLASTKVIAGGSLGRKTVYAQASGASSLTTTIDVVAGAVAALNIITEPASDTAGATFATTSAQLLDAFGNVVTTASNEVTLAIDASLTNGTIEGTTTATPVAGIVSFPGLRLTKAGPYKFILTATGLTPDTTASFDVSTAAATEMMIVSGNNQPTAVGAALAQPMRIRVRDAFGNPIAGIGVVWGVSVGVSAVDSTVSYTDADGYAEMGLTMATTLEDPSVDAAYGDLRVTFTHTGTAGAATSMEITGMPGDRAAGSTLSPITVTLRDTYRNVATAATGSVSVALATSPASSTLSGTTSASLTLGVATFSDLVLTKTGQYVLRFSTSGLTDADTDPFFITAAAPDTILVLYGDPQTVTVGGTSDSMVVQVKDAFGNPVPDLVLNWSSSVGTALTFASTSTDADGRALNYLGVGTTAGSLSASVGGEGLSTRSFAITASAGTAVALRSVSAPTTATSGSAADAFVIEAVDEFDNRVTAFTGNVTIAKNVEVSPNGSIGGTLTVAAVAGVATFDDLLFSEAGSYGLVVSADGLTGFNSSINVQAGAEARVALVAQPSSGTAGTVLDQFIVRVVDAAGNVVGGSSANITVAVDASLTAGTLGGTTTQQIAEGSADFLDLELTTAGTFRLVFSAPGLVPDTSASFVISPAGASVVAVAGGNLQTMTAGAAADSALALRVTDTYGNPIVGWSVDWSATSGAVTLDSLVTTTDASGIARTTFRAGSTVGSIQIEANAGLAGSATFTAEATAGAAALLAITTAPVDAVAGATLAGIVVEAQDLLLNTATGFGSAVTVAIDNGPSGATLGGTLSANATAGVVTFSDLTLDKAGSYRLRFTADGLTQVVSDAFAIGAASADTVVIVSGDAQTDTVGATADTLVIRVVDGFGNPISGAAIDWTRSTETAGLFVLDASTDGDGLSRAIVTLGSTPQVVTITATHAALTPATFTLTSTPATPTTLFAVSAPSSITSPGTGETFEIEVRDAYGNRVTVFNDSVGVVLVDGPDGGVLGGVTKLEAVNGLATFSGLTVTTVGDYTLRFGVAGLDSVNVMVGVVAGTPANMTVVSGDAQAGFATLALDSPIVLRVTDAAGNRVAGDSIILTITAGGGTLANGFSADTLITDESGEANVTWTLGTTLGTQSLSAAAGALGPVTITAEAQELLGNRIWTGDVSSTWNDAGNWLGGTAPTASDSVYIPAGRPNDPSMTAPATIARFTLADGATLTTNNYILTISGRVSVPNTLAIPGSSEGGFSLTSSATDLTLSGAFPRTYFGNGRWTVSGSWSAGDVQLHDGAELAMADGGTATVGSLYTFTNATISMVPGATLNVGGTLWMSGGSTVGKLTGGTLRVGANILVDNSTAFVADSAHTTILTGEVSQYLNFNAFADTSLTTTCSSACFGRLVADKPALGGSVVFQSNAKAIGGFDIEADALDATGQYLVSPVFSTLRGINTTIRKYASFGGFDQATNFAVDTLVFWGNGTLASGPSIPGVVVGDYTMVNPYYANLSVEGSLDIDGPNARVAGTLTTRGDGHLVMTDASDSLVVDGELRFEGSASAGELTAGVIQALSNVTVGSGSALFADSAHVLLLSGANPVLTVSDSTNTRFGSLRLQGSTSVGFSGVGAKFAGDVTISDAAEFVVSGSEWIEIGGRLVDPAGNRFLATTILTGTNALVTPAFGADLLYLRGTNALADSLNAYGVIVESGGSLQPNGFRAVVEDSLVTTGTGIIAMDDAADTLTVLGPALFNGGSSVLTAGVLRVQGRFDVGSQRGFQAQSTHTTEFFGPNAQQVGFSYPGTGSFESHFGRVVLNKSGGAPSSSTIVYVAGELVTATASQVWSGIGWAGRLYIAGADIDGLSLVNQPLIIRDGPVITSLADLQFSNFADGVTQLAIERGSGTVNLVSPAFDTLQVLPEYLAAVETASGDADTLTVVVSDPSPAFHGGNIAVLNGAKITGWEDFSALVWSGAVDNAWTTVGNWEQGRIPTAADSVIIPGLAPTAPTITADASVRSFMYQRLGGMNLSATLTIQNRYSGGGETSAISCGTGGRIVLASADSSLASGQVSCPVYVTSGTMRTTGNFTVDSLIIEGAGEVHLRESQYLEVVHDLRTADNGTLRMEGSSETVVQVGGTATFRSVPAIGALSGGSLLLAGDFIQDSTPLAFRPSASHVTRFVGLDGQSIGFTHPDPVSGSFFGDVAVELGSGQVLTLQSDVYIEGRLIGDFNNGGTLFGDAARSLRSRGASVGSDGDLRFENVTWTIVGGDTLNANLHNVSFTGITAGAMPQLQILRDSGTVTLHQFGFDTGAPTPLYLRVEDTAASDFDTLAVTLNLPTPSFHAGAIATVGGAQVLGWDESGPTTWLGSISGDFATAANWSSGVVPTASDSITVSASAANALVIGSDRTIGALVVEAGSLGVDVRDTLTISRALVMQGGAPMTCTSGTPWVYLNNADAAPQSLRATAPSCYFTVLDGDYVLADSTSSVRFMKVQGGSLDIANQRLNVVDNLETTQTGVLAMNDPAAWVEVEGQALFGGGSETGRLTAGTLAVRLAFLQGGDTFSSFVSGPGLRVVLGDSLAPATDSIDLNFNNPDSSVVGRLEVVGGTWRSNYGLRARALQLRGIATLAGNGWLRVDSTLTISADGSRLDLPKLSVTGNLFPGNSFDVDTVEMLGQAWGSGEQAIPVLASANSYKTLRTYGNVRHFSMGPATLKVANRLEVVSGDFRVQSTSGVGAVSIAADTADLIVGPSGRFIMRTIGTVSVDSAHFEGLSTSGYMRAGRLRVRGALVQRSTTSNEAFRPDSMHITEFVDSVTVDLEDPTNSKPAYVELGTNAALLLKSDLEVYGKLSHVTGGPADTVAISSDVLHASPRRLRLTSDVDLYATGGGRLRLRNVPLVLASTGASVALGHVTFTEMDSASTYLDLTNFSGYTASFDGMRFETPVTTGRYFDLGSGSTVAFPNAYPSIGCLSAPDGCAGPRYEPSPSGDENVWTGAESTDWQETLNWSLGVVPRSFDDVRIPGGLAQYPSVTADTIRMRNFVVDSAASISLLSRASIELRGGLTVGGDILGLGTYNEVEPNRTVIRFIPETGLSTVQIAGSSSWAYIAADLELAPRADASIADFAVSGTMYMEGRLDVQVGILDVNGTWEVDGTTRTSGSGRIRMNSASDTLRTVYFDASGGSTDGLLTAGFVSITAGVTQQGGAADAYAASPGHLTELRAFGQPNSFQNPGIGSGSSHFGDLKLSEGIVQFGSSAFATGRLLHGGGGPGAQGMEGENHTLTVSGANLSDLTMNGMQLVIAGSEPIVALGGLRFINQHADSTQLTIVRSGGSVTLPSTQFYALSGPAVGKYLVARDIDINGNALVIDVVSPSPAGHDGRIAVDGEASIQGWDQFAEYVFTGAAAPGDITDTGNWSSGVLPTAISTVRFSNAAAGDSVYINSNFQARNVLIDPGAKVAVNAWVTVGGALAFGEAPTCGSSGEFVMQADGTTAAIVSGQSPYCGVRAIEGNYQSVGSATLRYLTVGSGAQFYLGSSTTAERLHVLDSLSVLNGGSFAGFGALGTDTLTVDGLFRVASGASSSFNAGRIELLGGVNVTGGLVAENAAHVYLGDSLSPATRNVSIVSDNARLDSLTIFPGTTIVDGTLHVGLSLVQAGTGSNVLTGDSVIIGRPGDVDGRLFNVESGSVTVANFVLAGTLDVSGGFSPDTVTFAGRAAESQRIPSINASEAQIPYGYVRVHSDGFAVYMDGTEYGNATSYQIADGLELSKGVLSVVSDVDSVTVQTPKLLVTGTGFVEVAAASTKVRLTADTIQFTSQQTSTLEAGVFEFSQLLTAGVGEFGYQAQFYADTNHTFRSIGSATIDLTGTSGNVELGRFEFEGGDVITLQTDMSVKLLARRAGGSGLATLRAPAFGEGNSVELSLASLTLPDGVGTLLSRNVRMRLTADFEAPGSPSFAVNNLRFEDMDPQMVFLTADFNGAVNPTFTNVDFNSAVTTGAYFYLVNNIGSGGSPQVTFVNASPSVDCLSGTCRVGDSAPTGTSTTATFIEEVGSDWHEPTHWSTGQIPDAGTDVVIPAGRSVALFSDATAKSIQVDSGGTLGFGGTLKLTVWGDVSVTGDVVGFSGTVEMRHVPGGSVLAVPGTMESDLRISAGLGGYADTVRLGSTVHKIENFASNGTFVTAGVLSIGQYDLIDSGSFRTSGSGRLMMDHPNGELFIEHDVEFAGGSTEGLLTAGEISIRAGDFIQDGVNSNKSFVSTGSHRVSFNGPFSTRVIANSMTDSTSRFNSVYFLRTGGDSTEFASDTVVIGSIPTLSGILRFTGGSLIVTGSLGDVSGHLFSMESPQGIVDLRGSLPAPCSTSSLNVVGYKGQFIPSSCHTAELLWFYQDAQTSNALNAVWSSGTGVMFAVGDNGTIRFSDQTGSGGNPGGVTWAADSAAQEDHLLAVHGLAAGPDTVIYAAGVAGRIVWRNSLSASWSVYSHPSAATWRGVYVISADSVVIVGDGGQIIVGSGTSWAAASSGTLQDLYGITRAGSTFVVAGAAGTLRESEDGITWTSGSSGLAANLLSVAAVSGTERYVGGVGGTLAFDDGSSILSLGAAPRPMPQAIRGVTATGTTGLAVGDNARVLHQQGQSWTTISSAPTVVGLRGVTRFLDAVTEKYVAIVVAEDGSIYYVAIGDGPPS